MKTLAEAAAAKESAEIEKRIAANKTKGGAREARERTRSTRADKKIATASAKAAEDILEEEELGEKVEFLGIPVIKNEERTFAWGNSPRNNRIPPETTDAAEGNPPQNGMPYCIIPWKPHIDTRQQEADRSDNVLGQSFVTSTPMKLTGSELVEALTSVNQRIVASLARQSLPVSPRSFLRGP